MTYNSFHLLNNFNSIISLLFILTENQTCFRSHWVTRSTSVFLSEHVQYVPVYSLRAMQVWDFSFKNWPLWLNKQVPWYTEHSRQVSPGVHTTVG
jgi:hypothetical protein